MENLTPNSVRYHALDIWRGVVCLVVVLEHAAIALSISGQPRIPGQSYWVRDAIAQLFKFNLGAPLFFVISGYCIAASLDSTRRKGISPALFLGRRLWRIFPPYWASMAIIALIVVGLDFLRLPWLYITDLSLRIYQPSSFSLSQWLGNITLTELWRQSAFGGDEVLWLNRVAWALCYQEQFYLICFLALVFFPKRLYAALAWATFAIIGYRLVASDVGWANPISGFFPDLWHEFAVGLALFWRINVAKSFWSKRAVEACFIAMLAFGVWQGMGTTIAAAVFGLVLLVFHRWDLVIAKMAQFNCLRACGKRSYSVYLIHFPICTVGNSALAWAGMNNFWLRLFVMIPAVTVASVAAAWIFFAGVDRHFRNLPLVGRFSRLVKPPQPGVAITQAQV